MTSRVHGLNDDSAQRTRRAAARFGGETLRALWQVHPPVAVLVGVAPQMCLQTLITATRPSVHRLHHRELFTEGRRYYLQPRMDGFRLTSDSKVFWGKRKQRQGAAAILDATFVQSGGDSLVTLVRLRSRMKPSAVLSALLLPAFMTTILIYLPWGTSLVVFLIIALFLLSWLGHRFNAAYQANEMVYFVRKVLEDLPSVTIPELVASGPDLVVDPQKAPRADIHTEFMNEWERFYQERTGE
jgi:hypothetical protein